MQNIGHRGKPHRLGIVGTLFASLLFSVVCESSRAETRLPKNVLAHANALLDAGHFNDAIAAFTEAIRLNPKDFEAYHCRAFAFQKMGQPSRAIADYTEAIRLDPTAPNPHINRGDARRDGRRSARGVAGRVIG